MDSLGALWYKGNAKKACRVQWRVTKIPKGIEHVVYEELGLFRLAGEGSLAKAWSKISGPEDFQNLAGQGHEQSDLTLKLALGRYQKDRLEALRGLLHLSVTPRK